MYAGCMSDAPAAPDALRAFRPPPPRHLKLSRAPRRELHVDPDRRHHQMRDHSSSTWLALFCDCRAAWC